MSSRAILSVPGRLTLLALLVATCGCGPRARFDPRPNLRPTVELTRAPYNSTSRFSYSYRMNWIGTDPDGRVDYYRYAVDPPGPTAANPDPETTWVNTALTEHLIEFSATQPDSTRPHVDGSSDFHTFVVKAIDNGGAGGPLQSAPLVRAFFSFTIAPTVRIISPAPNDRAREYVTPSVRISWVGFDEDGVFHHQKPVQYKYILLTQNSPVPFSVALATPDSVRRYYAPRHWAGWDSTSAETTTVQFRNLIPSHDYMFVVIAIDEAGAYSPVFSLNSNMLNMRATYAAAGGPTLTVWSDIFFYTYNPPTRDPGDQYQIKVEIPAGEQITIHWSAVAGAGADVVGYRWGLDLADIDDYTPRSNERTDLGHWSQLSTVTSATVGPFGPQEVHYFYVESQDNNDLKSLAVVRLSVVGVPLDRDLLVVDDTRYIVDQRTLLSPCIDRPRGRWPYAAELDTFLFAQGGFPWRCYPAGTITTPGLFAGYAFDTLGTRTGRSEVRVPLSVLGRYRHVVWMTDPKGGYYDAPGTNLSTSIGALRYMTHPGRANSLAAYIHQGGEVWLAGGGAAFAATIEYNSPANDVTNPAPGTTFSARQEELIPGRFMYDVFHWQSEIKVNTGRLLFTRYRGRFDASGHVAPAEYDRLPSEMRPKDAALGDVFPPNRTYSSGDFYTLFFDVEYLSQANIITEDVNPDLLVVDEQSTLDTLYQAQGSSLMPPSFNPVDVCMTRYSGPAYTHVIFTGFNFWTFARVDCQALVDAVLQGFWHLERTPQQPRAARSTPVGRAPVEDAGRVAGGEAPGRGAAARTR